MIESIISFAAGYFVCAVLRSNTKVDRVLYWSKDCLGWRPVTHSADVDPSLRYLAAYEIDPPVLATADSSTINDDESGRPHNS